MNKMIQKQLDHRTIRFFKDQSVKPEQVQKLLEVMNRTATSNGLQSASVIRITDPEKKKKISEIGKQHYIADAPELWIFIVDVYRNSQIVKEKGYAGDSVRSANFFIQAFTDACLMAQNVVNAAEAIGLGTVYLGSILNDAQELIDLLDLPELTLPVVGLGFGEIDDDPELKPRMPVEMRIYENHYQPKESYLDALASYDQEMTHYYDTRKKNQRSDTFTNQVLRHYEKPNETRAKYFEIAEKQGFHIFRKP